MKLTVDPAIRAIPHYPKAAKYGAGAGWLRLSSNENPFPPSEKVMAAVLDAVLDMGRYPESEAELKSLVAAHYGIKPGNVFIGNGSNEVIETSLRAMRSPGRNRVLIPEPSFAFYQIASKIYGYEPVMLPLPGLTMDLEKTMQAIDESTRVVFLNNPNNPTGTIFTEEEFRAFLGRLPEEVLVVVDEAYAEFATAPTFPKSISYVNDFPILLLRTFSKAYGLAGLRVGYGIGEENLVSFLERTKQPFSVNMVALAAAKAALSDHAHLRKVLENNSREKACYYDRLTSLGLDFYRTEANFILVRVGSEAENITRRLFDDRILIRWMGAYGLKDYVRVTIGTAEENRRLLRALEKML